MFEGDGSSDGIARFWFTSRYRGPLWDSGPKQTCCCPEDHRHPVTILFLDPWCFFISSKAAQRHVVSGSQTSSWWKIWLLIPIFSGYLDLMMVVFGRAWEGPGWVNPIVLCTERPWKSLSSPSCRQFDHGCRICTSCNLFHGAEFTGWEDGD